MNDTGSGIKFLDLIEFDDDAVKSLSVKNYTEIQVLKGKLNLLLVINGGQLIAVIAALISIFK